MDPEAAVEAPAGVAPAPRVPPPPARPWTRRAARLRGPLVYYLLAAFDVLTVSASLYLNRRLTDIYVRSVEANQEWAQRMADYAALGQLAAEVNAPGNDVFDSQDATAERIRMQAALRDFNSRVFALRAELRRSVAPSDAQVLLAHMRDVEHAMDEMVAEARLIFAAFEAGRGADAGVRMATMDRKYNRLLATLRELGGRVALVQRRQFLRQTEAAAALQRFEHGIAGLILLMVAAATLYGRRLSRQSAHDAVERAAYIRDLQAAEASLRQARDRLEERVFERTQALHASEAALRRAAADWQRTFEAIDQAVMVLDPDGRVLRLNRAALALAARQEDLVRDRPLEALGEAEPWPCAAEVARRVLARRGAAAREARDPESGRTWEVSGNLVPDEQGQGAERVIVVARDVTRLVELQESVRREERMAAMGSLVAGVAHEVRNPLFGISSTLDALEARHGSGEALRRYTEVLRREVDRLRALMQDLLDYGKPPVLERATTDLGAVVSEAVRLCEPLAGSVGARILREGAERGPRVDVDRARVVQVLQNLVQNALQHSPPGGCVTIAVGQTLESGVPWAWCSVRDEGPGFQTADLARLFEPFFTRRRGGTGLGLSIAQRVVTQHGGVLEADNHPAGGALMTLRLPLPPPGLAS